MTKKKKIKRQKKLKLERDLEWLLKQFKKALKEADKHDNKTGSR